MPPLAHLQPLARLSAGPSCHSSCHPQSVIHQHNPQSRATFSCLPEQRRRAQETKQRQRARGTQKLQNPSLRAHPRWSPTPSLRACPRPSSFATTVSALLMCLLFPSILFLIVPPRSMIFWLPNVFTNAFIAHGGERHTTYTTQS